MSSNIRRKMASAANKVEVDVLREDFRNVEMENVTDFHIKSTEGEVFYCQKAHFYILSDYFESLFSERVEKRNGKIWEPGQPSFVIRALAKWAYLSEIQTGASLEEYLKIVEFANLYRIEEMVRVYGEEMKKKVTEENVFDILIFADQNNADHLKEMCLEFIVEKKLQITQDHRALSWDLLRELANR